MASTGWNKEEEKYKDGAHWERNRIDFIVLKKDDAFQLEQGKEEYKYGAQQSSSWREY